MTWAPPLMYTPLNAILTASISARAWICVGGSGKPFPGGASGTTTDDGIDAAPTPILFTAAAVHVYFFPTAMPLTVIGD